MKYMNDTMGVLKFRAHNDKDEKVVFKLNPGEEVELGREAFMGGLKRIKNSKKIKKGDE